MRNKLIRIKLHILNYYKLKFNYEIVILVYRPKNNLLT